MAFNTVVGQWSSIVLDFEVAVAYQQRKISLEKLDGEEIVKFNEAGLAVLEKGLAKARKNHRKAGVAFWKTPTVATTQLLLNELNELKKSVEKATAKDGVSRAGELSVIDRHIEGAMDKMTVTSATGQRTLIPGYHD